MDADESSVLRELMDREAIRDTIGRYCHAIDRGDEDVLREIYWPQATEEHAGMVSGSASNFIREAMRQILTESEEMQHLVGNSTIRIERPRANVESYFFVYQRIPALNAGQPQWIDRVTANRADLLVGGRYLDSFECRDNEWRILHRIVVFDWWRLFEGSADWRTGLTGSPILMGQRGSADAAYDLFAGLGLGSQSQPGVA